MDSILNTKTAVINLRHLRITLQVPNYFGDTRECTLIWIRTVKDNFYTVSLYDGEGYVIWLCRIDDEFNVEFISNACGLESKELPYFNLATKLNFAPSQIIDNLMLKRVEEYCNDNPYLYSKLDK